MRNSSKDVDLLVRVGVLEKLIDKLVDRVNSLSVSVTGTENKVDAVIKVVQTFQSEPQDPWQDTGVQEQPKDEVGQLLDT